MGKPIPPTPTHVLKQVENNIKFHVETREVLRPISKDITTLSPTANQIEELYKELTTVPVPKTAPRKLPFPSRLNRRNDDVNTMGSNPGGVSINMNMNMIMESNLSQRNESSATFDDDRGKRVEVGTVLKGYEETRKYYDRVKRKASELAQSGDEESMNDILIKKITKDIFSLTGGREDVEM